MFKFIKNMERNYELEQKVNTLENENELLKNQVIKIVLDKLGETETTKRLRESNKRLRLKNKELKEILNEEGIKRKRKTTI